MKELISIEIITDYSKEKNREVGIKFFDNKVYVMFPHGYRCVSDQRNINRDIIKMINLFDRFNRRKSSGIISEKNKFYLSGQNDSSFPFGSAIWLLSDFQKNGFLINRQKTSLRSTKGKINWNKTIKSIVPLLIENNIYYNEYLTSRKRDSDSMLIDIHKYTVKRSLEILGWIYPNLKLTDDYKLPMAKDSCIKILKQEIHRNSNDKLRLVYNHMLKLLMYDNGDEVSTIFFKNVYTDRFEYIWEDMIFYLLNNVNLLDYYPSAYWSIDNQTHMASYLRPDSVLKIDESTNIVIDAKYYKYGITSSMTDLPQSSDIMKQISYSNFLKGKIGGDFINCFLIPKNLEDKDFDIFGYSNYTRNNKTNVYGVFLDTNTVVDRYLSGSNLDLKTSLINKVKELSVDRD